MNLNVILANVITGGFLKGKRTSLIAIGILVTTLIQYLTGDIDLTTFIKGSWEQIALAVGIVTAAASGNS